MKKFSMTFQANFKESFSLVHTWLLCPVEVNISRPRTEKDLNNAENTLF